MQLEIKRVNNYTDTRFSKKVLAQHGCFLINEEPYEVEIISDSEAIVRGKNRGYFEELIEQFRFFTPHITMFYDSVGSVIKQYADAELIEIALEDIQPSQFYVDADKVAAIRSFIHRPEDIIIQVSRETDGYISLDGHTRLYYAWTQGFDKVRAVLAETDECIYDFVQEAIRRGIRSPKDLILLEHEEYEIQWNRYCEEYFEGK